MGHPTLCIRLFRFPKINFNVFSCIFRKKRGKRFLSPVLTANDILLEFVFIPTARLVISIICTGCI